ncbi:MAG: HDIG domain-containing protein [Tenacibaculum sp.]|nr:HDIG domain-containing protein [Tenacibaculum sp.]
MNEFINKLYKNNATVYKILLFLVTVVAIVYLLPKGGQFKYEFKQGKPWQYNNLYAPFDFSIQKTKEEIALEKKQIKDNANQYFIVNTEVKEEVLKKLAEKINSLEVYDSLYTKKINSAFFIGKKIIDKVYKVGFIDDLGYKKVSNTKSIIELRNGNYVSSVPVSELFKSNEILPFITDNFKIFPDYEVKSVIINNLLDILKPNVSFDFNFTQKELNELLNNISYTKGKISKEELIILKGSVVDDKSYNILNSYKSVYKAKTLNNLDYKWIVFGYSVLVSLALLMILLFLKKYHIDIFNNNNKVTFILFNVFLMIFVQTLVVKYIPNYLYIVPLGILPIVLKAFFDARLGLFTHILTVLLLGFIVPESFEFIYIYIIGGIVTVLTISELYKRGNLFISIGRLTLVYILTYLAFSIIKEGNINGVNWNYFGMFAVNGLLSFLAVFFIYFYEKVFGLVSDITLLELSSTNSKLLRELNEKAPGTFQHSMQVANLAESAANEIGANAMLVRTGALYHDIGKMINPQYFIENQSTGVNPHNDLSPKDSAKIIIDHVIKGVELAKKHNLPDRIIDFIRTHHGTSLVYYFYKNEMDNSFDGEVDINKFKYKGPIPYSKETAILMMCDATEAASKSLKNPTAQSIDELIDKIIEKQSSENQFINSNITFREIEKIKKVIKSKLMNIYHLRIEYPE